MRRPVRLITIYCYGVVVDVGEFELESRPLRTSTTPGFMRLSFGDRYIRPPSSSILRTHTTIVLHEDSSTRLISSGRLLHKESCNYEEWFAVKPLAMLLYHIVKYHLSAPARSFGLTFDLSFHCTFTLSLNIAITTL